MKLTDEEWAVFEGSSVHVGAHEVVSGIACAPGGRVDVQDWRSVDRELRSLGQRRAALDVEEARLLLIARRLDVHVPLGYGTFVEYVERVLGYRPRTTQERLRVAERLEELPATRAALAAGEVSYSAVRELTRVATPATEDAWLPRSAAGRCARSSTRSPGAPRATIPTPRPIQTSSRAACRWS